MEVKRISETFHSGNMTNAYKYFGAHFAESDGISGVIFRLWAPNIFSVSVIGDFNLWDHKKTPMKNIDAEESIWEVFVPYVNEFDSYKYCIITNDGRKLFKSDPYAFHGEVRPGTASKVYNLSNYAWHDNEWMKPSFSRRTNRTPMNIYEVHLGSWRCNADGTFYSYKDIARELIPYVKEHHFTHIELLPIAEHPLDASWGYQVTGYFSATSRYGTPSDLMYFIDECHKAGIGVILDWVTAHFPKDEHGLSKFTGSNLYEYADPLKSEHPEWGTMIFDFSRGEVISFLISNVFFWLDIFHFDGIRVDAVASMLYLDYGKRNSAWRANVFGKNGNLEAEQFLKKLNTTVKNNFPNVIMIAEESTTWPNITKPVESGGLGFDFKWNMGWMNDTLEYFSTDPIFRKHKQNSLTFSLSYAFSENYILPFSHDEVVYGKSSLINKQPGDYETKFSGLRTMLGYMMAHPGKKLNFMGNELAQFSEWNHAKALDWNLLNFEMHKKFLKYVRTLNYFYLNTPALWEIDDSWAGFEWISHNDAERNILIFKRRDLRKRELICAFNFAPVERTRYTFDVGDPGIYSVVFSSAENEYGGEGINQAKTIFTKAKDREKAVLSITLPPLSATFITKKGRFNYVKNKRMHCNVTCRRTRKQT